MGDTTGRQLNISDLKLNNSGNYTNTLTNTVNGTENRMNRTIELRVLSEFIYFCHDSITLIVVLTVH